MIINLNDRHKEHLKILFNQHPQVIEDFCSLCISYLTSGPNIKLYTSVSKKLNVSSPNIIQNSIEGFIYFLLLSTILNLNEYDFYNTLYNIGFEHNEENEKYIYTLYNKEKYILYKLLIQQYIHLEHFKSLEWRFEGILASRSFLNDCEPKFTVRLHLENYEQKEKCIDIELNPSSVINITKCLEEALSYAKLNQRKINKRKQIMQKNVTS